MSRMIATYFEFWQALGQLAGIVFALVMAALTVLEIVSFFVPQMD